MKPEAKKIERPTRKGAIGIYIEDLEKYCDQLTSERDELKEKYENDDGEPLFLSHSQLISYNKWLSKELQTLKGFIKWYSGIEQSKIDKAYQRFIKEYPN